MEQADLVEYVKQLETAFSKTMRKIGPQLANLADGLTPPQFFVLGFLQSRQRTVTEIAEVMGVQPSAITAILDRMHKSGFISRERSATDRRVVEVYITDRGREVYKKSQARRLHVMTHYLGYLKQEELEQLLRIYEKLSRIIEEKPAPLIK